MTAVLFTACGGWQFYSKSEVRKLDIFQAVSGGRNRVRKKSVSMRKLKLRELNAENCVLSDPNRSDFEITNDLIASDSNRNSKKSLRLRKHPLKPTLWTREPPALCGFYSVSEAPHGSGTPPEYVATTRV